MTGFSTFHYFVFVLQSHNFPILVYQTGSRKMFSSLIQHQLLSIKGCKQWCLVDKQTGAFSSWNTINKFSEVGGDQHGASNWVNIGIIIGQKHSHKFLNSTSDTFRRCCYVYVLCTGNKFFLNRSVATIKKPEHLSWICVKKLHTNSSLRQSKRIKDAMRKWVLLISVLFGLLLPFHII